MSKIDEEMISFPSAVRAFLCTRSVDLRKSFDILAQLVPERLAGDPPLGHLYVFRNASVREPDARATLPEPERADWRALWDEVDRLLKEAGTAH